MKTFLSIGFLLILGIVAKFVAIFALNLAGALGALIGGQRGARLTARYIFGTAIAFICQSYLYLGFVAFIVNWVSLGVRFQGLPWFAVWPAAFLAVVAPIWLTYAGAIAEQRENKDKLNPNTEALGFTMIASFLMFFVFAIFPQLVRALYGWLPYVS